MMSSSKKTSKGKVTVLDWGKLGYRESWAKQHLLFDAMVAMKKNGTIPDEEFLIMVEHEPVVTLGKHAKASNILIPEAELARRGVECVNIERGGDVTFHGPGQLVAYPILDLEQHKLGVKDYVNLLEESVIQTLAEYGIKGERKEGASGVWIGKDTPTERKICALGVKCSRFCTMHGLALNVNTDLSWFGMINPCGFIDKGVTSMKLELGKEIEFEEVKKKFSDVFLRLILSL